MSFSLQIQTRSILLLILTSLALSLEVQSLKGHELSDVINSHSLVAVNCKSMPLLTEHSFACWHRFYCKIMRG